MTFELKVSDGGGEGEMTFGSNLGDVVYDWFRFIQYPKMFKPKLYFDKNIIYVSHIDTFFLLL